MTAGLPRYFLLRRLIQLTILFLFFGGNAWGWKALQGNLSTSRVFGIITLADPFSVLQMAAAGTLAAGRALSGAVIVLVFFGFLGGRIFCSWICPMNIVTDTASSLRRTLGFGAGKTILHRNVRYWLLGTSIVLSAILGFAAFEWISPVSMLHRGIVYGMGIGWTVIGAIFLFDMVVQQHGFCGHICPLGAFYAVVGRYGIIKVRHDNEKCTRCLKCLDICPEPQVLHMIGKTSEPVVSGECTNCGRCIEVCEDRAMQFWMSRLQQK